MTSTTLVLTGLQSAPNVGENGVHASAGPLEGLKERMVWLGLTPSTDSFGQKMLEVLWNDTGDGVLAKLLSDTDFEFAGKVFVLMFHFSWSSKVCVSKIQFVL